MVGIAVGGEATTITIRAEAMSACLDDDALARWLDGELSPGELAKAEAHLDHCRACSEVLAESVRALGSGESSPESGDPPEPADDAAEFALEPGSTLGRHVILELVGVGGMGVVYSAYDPDLDRKVALKLIRPDAQGGGDLRRRLLAEAQALARLSHPNVVTVYDVGTAGTSIFLALEYLDGETLAQWLAKERRPHNEIVRVFAAAGRGLGAAHAAGIIHRDFKPANVFLCSDGRVVVGDFGLAHSMPGTALPARVGSAEQTTRAGTPAYMAPEQLRGRAVDERTDVFGFCVALFEALYGRRPFAGNGREASAASIEKGPVFPAGKSPVPGWLRGILTRGLQPDPAARFSSMDALVRALSRDRARKWRSAAPALAAIVLLGTALLLYEWARDDAPPYCLAAPEKLAGIWDPGAKERVRKAFVGSGAPYATDALVRVQRSLDGYARRWVKAHTGACRATRVHGEQTEAVLTLRMECLERRREHLAALVRVFERADTTVVANAPSAAEALPDLRRCADVEALQARQPPPGDAATARRAKALQRRIARAHALLSAGKVREAVPLAKGSLHAARKLGYAPLVAEALFVAGLGEKESGRMAAAEKLFTDAFFASLPLRFDETAANAAVRLIWVVGRRLARYPEAHLWARHAQGLLEQRGAQPRLEMLRLSYLGAVLRRQGRYEEAVRLQERSVQLARRSGGDSFATVATLLNNLAVTRLDQGRWEEGARMLRAALRAKHAAVGRLHPAAARIEANLGRIELVLGRHREAMHHLEQARSVLSRVGGATHPAVAKLLLEMAKVHLERGRLPEALRLVHRARRSLERQKRRRSRYLASIHYLLGNIFFRQGRWKDTLREQRAAFALHDRFLGPRSTARAWSLVGLAEPLVELGQRARARTLLQQARAIFRKHRSGSHPGVPVSAILLGRAACLDGRSAEGVGLLRGAASRLGRFFGRPHRWRAWALLELGECYLSWGKPEEARVALEEALQIFRSSGLQPGRAARARFLLARALWSLGRQRSRALRLASRARETLAQRRLRPAREKTVITRWLVTRRLPAKASAPPLPHHESR